MTTINIASHLKEMAVRSPEQWAVLFPKSRDSSGRTVYSRYNYQQLDQESDYLAAGLDQMQVGRGVKAVLMVPPSLEFFALTFALFKVGAVPVLVDPGMGIKNLGRCLAEAQPTAFIGIAKAHVARLLFGWGKSSLTRYVTVGRRFGWGGANLQDVTQEGHLRQTLPENSNVRWQPAATQSDETAAILFTSGSTGVPKGAVYSYGNFAAQVTALQRVFGIQPGEIDLCTFPLFALFAPALGMTAVIPRMDFTKPARVDPREIDQPIQEFKINNLFGSPALLNRVGREGLTASSTSSPDSPTAKNSAATTSTGKLPNVWPSLRRVLSAGAPVSPLILERFSRRLPTGAQIFTPYGATESLPVAVIGSEEILGETQYLTAKGAGTCVGRPVDEIEVRIIGITDGPINSWSEELCLPVGEIGEIVVHGPMVTQSYYQRPDLTVMAKIHDPATGRFRHRMGDVGYFDTAGRLWFCGRKTQRVVSGGRTYFTELVEGVFNTHPAVFRTALVGVPQSGKIEPILCVERDRDLATRELRHLTDAALTTELLQIGAGYEHTRVIRRILFHRSFPVDVRHNSKIFREKLALWAAKQL